MLWERERISPSRERSDNKKSVNRNPEDPSLSIYSKIEAEHTTKLEWTGIPNDFVIIKKKLKIRFETKSKFFFRGLRKTFFNESLPSCSTFISIALPVEESPIMMDCNAADHRVRLTEKRKGRRSRNFLNQPYKPCALPIVVDEPCRNQSCDDKRHRRKITQHTLQLS